MAKILIIDSDIISCKILQRALHCHGHEVAIARRGGNQGLVMAVTERPDLLVVGLNDPTADTRVVELLQTSAVTSDIPVLALAVETSSEVRAAVYAAGCSGLGVKPLDLGRLLRQIRRLTQTGSRSAVLLRVLPPLPATEAAEAGR